MPNRNLLFVVYIKNELILLYQFLDFFSATYFNHSKYLNVLISVMKNRLMDNKVITFSFLLKSKFYHLILRFLSVWFNTEHRKSISNMKEEYKIIIEITGNLEILSSAWTLMNLYLKTLNVSEKNLLKMTWFVSVIKKNWFSEIYAAFLLLSA